jgi:cobalt-precorrin 5A hydrolase / precorrin-3B C17-methyltransferase
VIGLVAATRRGEGLAAHLAAAWPHDARLYPGRCASQIPRAWGECDGLALFMAAGAAVRLIAPLLSDKARDPGVVCIDDAARFAIALAGGHEGGANALAVRVGEALGAKAIVTTASDALGYPALDALGADIGFRIDSTSQLAAVGAALVGGERVSWYSDLQWPLPALPANVVRTGQPEAPCLVVSDRICDVPAPAVIYRPASLVLGVGCSRGAFAEAILALVDATLAEGQLSPLSVRKLATVDVKADEAGLIEAASRRGWSMTLYPADTLAEVQVPNPSQAVRVAVGTPSVAEASVVASGASIVVSKRTSEQVTVAVGRVPPRGGLYVVGTGPGDLSLIPAMTRDALARCAVVVGLDRYVDQIAPLLRPGCVVISSRIGDEIARAETAVAEATAGAAVALVSGGDVGVYAMASPALALAPAGVDVVSVPGITAASAAASLLGSPLGHDHCSISLSDLLTPWEVIERRIAAAAAADFVIAFYNPKSRARDWQLDEARRILLGYRKGSTPVGVVTDAFRAGQAVDVTSLEGLDVERVGMTSILLIGNSQTELCYGRMVTPRGYA